MPMFEKICRLGFVVRDLDKALELFCHSYGIGPWHKEGDRALCDIDGGVGIELAVPKGEGFFTDYMKDHGPGLAFISTAGGSGHAAGLTIKGQGSRRFYDLSDSLGLYVETSSEAMGKPNYPESGKMNKPLFTIIDQIGVVVKDIAASCKTLNDELGIGPWLLLDFGDCGDPNHVSVENCVAYGEDIGYFSLHCGICESLNIQLEIMEPVSEKSVHMRHLNKHGTDAQHVSLTLAGSYEEAYDMMISAGYTGMQISTVDKTETCCYCDHTDIIGIYFEIHKRPQVFVPPQVELKTYPQGLEISFGA